MESQRKERIMFDVEPAARRVLPWTCASRVRGLLPALPWLACAAWTLISPGYSGLPAGANVSRAAAASPEASPIATHQPAGAEAKAAQPPAPGSPSDPGEKIDQGCASHEDAEAGAPVPLPAGDSAHEPRWSCSQPVVTLDPAWRGPNFVFRFEIRNAGGADLTFLLKKT